MSDAGQTQTLCVDLLVGIGALHIAAAGSPGCATCSLLPGDGFRKRRRFIGHNNQCQMWGLPECFHWLRGSCLGLEGSTDRDKRHKVLTVGDNDNSDTA